MAPFQKKLHVAMRFFLFKGNDVLKLSFDFSFIIQCNIESPCFFRCNRRLNITLSRANEIYSALYIHIQFICQPLMKTLKIPYLSFFFFVYFFFFSFLWGGGG